MLLYGPAGTGKTTAVHALARDLAYDLLEVNASDTRNSAAINEIVGAAAQQQSLFSSGKIILLDELDGLSGMEDRGGIAALAPLLETPAHPIVCIANDPWETKLSSIRKKCVLIPFEHLTTGMMVTILQKVAATEKVMISEEHLHTLARRVGGDLRAAINDLEILHTSTQTITPDAIETLGDRERDETIFTIIQRIFKMTNATDLLHSFDSADLDFDSLFLWIEENLPREYSGEALAEAFDTLSLADVFRGRIRRQQHWRFLVYIKSLLTAGINAAQREPTRGFTKYERPTRILKLWIANQRYAKRKAIAEKLGEQLHLSTRRTVQEVLPYLPSIIRQHPASPMGLEEEEIAWLRDR